MSIIKIDQIYIYNFPELKPTIYAANIGWLRDPNIMIKKISKLNINKIIIQPWIGSYTYALESLMKKMYLPIYKLNDYDYNYDINNSLILFDTDDELGRKEFKDFFGYEIGKFGLLERVKFEIEI